MVEGSAEHFLSLIDHCTCDARCGEQVCWDLDDAIACTVDRIIHPELTQGVHLISIPDDPEVVARVFAHMRRTVMAECEGNA